MPERIGVAYSHHHVATNDRGLVFHGRGWRQRYEFAADLSLGENAIEPHKAPMWVQMRGCGRQENWQTLHSAPKTAGHIPMYLPQLRHSVVVVDDHVSVTNVMTYALQRELPEFTVLGITDLSDAPRRLREVKPAVAVVDWNFGADGSENPRSGSDLIRELTREIPDTRWILFTGFARPFVIKQALAAAVTGCVAKSADYSELVMAIREAIAGRAYFCPVCDQVVREIARAQSIVLSDTEEEILRRLSRGSECKQIASAVGLSVRSVQNYVTGLRKKLNASSLVDLARRAEERGITPPAG